MGVEIVRRKNYFAVQSGKFIGKDVPGLAGQNLRQHYRAHQTRTDVLFRCNYSRITLLS